ALVDVVVDVVGGARGPGEPDLVVSGGGPQVARRLRERWHGPGGRGVGGVALAGQVGGPYPELVRGPVGQVPAGGGAAGGGGVLRPTPRASGLALVDLVVDTGGVARRPGQADLPVAGRGPQVRRRLRERRQGSHRHGVREAALAGRVARRELELV